jgi:pyridoxamine 5'-phosphate oxidase
MSEQDHKDLGNVRREYELGRLDGSQMPSDPLILFQDWMDEATRSDLSDPTAMTLSTVDESGSPSSRVVLLKKIQDKKLVFFTSYTSKKAREMKRNPRVAAHFFWPGLERQVKISGMVSIIEDADSDRYFHSRPFESKISAWASSQSEVVPDREYLEKQYRHYLKKFEGSSQVPRPENWGGYAISPLRMEFWQGGRHRLHDRIEYTFRNGVWSQVRLAP